MKIALLHDWIIDIAGSENVFKAICQLFPNADIYTIIYDRNSLKKLGIENRNVYSSIVQKFPFLKKFYRHYFFIYPIIVEQFDLSKYDLIISSSHAFIKGVLKHSYQIHICYCHTPIRYAWDLYFEYMKSLNPILKLLAIYFFHKIRIWDYVISQRVDYFIANSNYVARRIKAIYNKDAYVIHPPVDVEKFEISKDRENYYITIGRFVPYKKFDIIVRAFSKMRDKKLIIIGDGPDFNKVKKIASSNVELLGYQSFENLKKYLSKAKAFVYMADEDFGISVVEAQACGIPVIAYKKGGVLETVIENKTGIFFNEQSEDSLISAINKFESIEDKFDSYEIRKYAEQFSINVFKEKFIKFLNSILYNFQL